MLGAALPMAILVVWELLGQFGVLSEDGFSRPTQIAEAGYGVLTDGVLLKQTVETFLSAAIGLALAVVVGVASGALLGLYRTVERMTSLVIEALRPVPSVALIPIALLIFGFGQNMTAAVVSFACLWPILLVTISAVRSIDSRILEVGRAMGFSFGARVIKFALPAALPGIMVGIRVAAGIAIVVAVTVEIAANPRGLGYGMIVAQQSLNAPIMWATLIWLGAVGFFANWALLRLERRWLAWYWLSRHPV